MVKQIPIRYFEFEIGVLWIGDWGLRIGDWGTINIGKTPIPNSKTPIGKFIANSLGLPFRVLGASSMRP